MTEAKKKASQHPVIVYIFLKKKTRQKVAMGQTDATIQPMIICFFQ